MWRVILRAVVSVVIPAYRAAGSIAATIESVLAQSFEDYEIIVVNDGSPDSRELEESLAPYADRITYIRQDNQGPAGARNTGILAARGEYVALLDADDLWEPDHLASQVGVLDADPSIDMVYADARIFGDALEGGRTLMELSPSAGDVTFESLVMLRCTVQICVSLVRRRTLLDAGLFDPAFRGTEDIDMWLRIVKRGGRIVYQRRVLGSYRRQAGSLSADSVHMIEGYLAVLAKADRDPNLTGTERQAIEWQCGHQRARLSLENGKRAFLAGDMDAAIRDLSWSNRHFKSVRLTLVVLLLRVSPRLLRNIYQWRYRHVYKLKTEP
ncbi:MAG: glycosyltransferase family A protein [Bryobacteraceae bacterium]|jgi:glycosyltransferase involved in cell wall biosynthesis